MSTRLILSASLWAMAIVCGLSGAASQIFADDGSGLLARCWPEAALAAREAERIPVRGAPGHAQSIPKIALSPFEPIPGGLRGAIRRVELPPGRKLIALTFDLCEQAGEIAGYDGTIVDYLRSHKIKATFFAGGKWLLTHGERAQQLMADPLFEIGNHGWVHRNVRGLAGPALTQEIRGPQAAYELQRSRLAQNACVAGNPAALSAIQPRLGLYRFPYGACSPEALTAVAAEGLLAIQWDVSTGDPAPSQSASAIAQAMVHRAKPGSIIIAHANGRGHHTAEALPLAIPKLKGMGYTFVTVSELLAAGKPVITSTCYDARPGDTDRYDYVFARRPETPRERAQAPPFPR